MTVEFHSGVADKLAYCCRLVRKAQAAQARVAVCGPGDLLDRLDAALWTFDALSFVPHVRLRQGATVPPALARTPVWLLDDAHVAPHREVLVNLGTELVPQWQTYARVVEVVQADDADRRCGRERWRQYSQAGAVELKHHVVGAEA